MAVLRLIAGLLFSCILAAAAADENFDAAAVALERYVAEADASYAWRVRARREQRGTVAVREIVGVHVDLVRHVHTSRDSTQSSRVST